ncbi:MAG: NUDIX hydrolase [Bacilli bacterium]|nr:NUDIX hydrolase [Bacilli bacterium]
MKEILYNYDNLNIEDINKEVKRAKAVIINEKEEILLGYGHKDYQIIGGHVEEGETVEECLIREVQEEAGIELSIEGRKPFICIKYMCKDYPKNGDFTLYTADYYAIYTNQKPDLSRISLTENEKEGMFAFRYIHKDKIVEELQNSLLTCTKPNVVRDTLDVIKEFIEISR